MGACSGRSRYATRSSKPFLACAALSNHSLPGGAFGKPFHPYILMPCFPSIAASLLSIVGEALIMERGMVKCCGLSRDHAASFSSFLSTNSPFTNFAPALTSGTR